MRATAGLKAATQTPSAPRANSRASAGIAAATAMRTDTSTAYHAPSWRSRADFAFKLRRASLATGNGRAVIELVSVRSGACMFARGFVGSDERPHGRAGAPPARYLYSTCSPPASDDMALSRSSCSPTAIVWILMWRVAFHFAMSARIVAGSVCSPYVGCPSDRM
jgi:hypothetical protein